MILEPEAYDIGRVKKFMKHLVLASKRSAERQQQREQVEKQVEKVKKLSLEKAPKVKLTKEWDRLEKALNTLTSANRQLIGAQESNSALLKKTLDKIDRLSDAISSMGGFPAAKKSLAEERMKELAGKIRSRFSEKDLELMEKGLEKVRTPATGAEVDAIERQLEMLEAKHAEMKESGKHDPASLKKLETMIKTSKRKLKGLKS